jgi:hypothetical protein
MGFFSDKRRVFPGYFQSKGNIFKNRLPGQQLEILKNKTDIPAQQIKFRSADTIQVDPVYQNMTARGIFSAKSQPEERGLPCPARPGYKDKFPFANPEVQII